MSVKPSPPTPPHLSASAPNPSNLPLLPPSFGATSLPAPAAPRTTTKHHMDTSAASDDLPFPPLHLSDSPNSLPSTPPHSPSTSACSSSPLSHQIPSGPPPRNTKPTTPSVTPAKPPRIKPPATSAPANRTTAHCTTHNSPVSPVTAAFQMQCASRALTTMADVTFPLLSPSPPGAAVMPALRPLQEMTDDELRLRLAQANSHDDDEDKKDPNDPEAHVRIWNRRERRKIAGNAAPLRRNVAAYLSTRPDCEVYNNQDKPAGWKPKKKIAKKKRQAQMLLVEIQRRERVRMEERRVLGSRGAGADGCRVCVEQAKSRVRYCGNYGCRVKRHRIDGKLHESLKGMEGSNSDEVGFEFEMTESCVSDVTGGGMVDLVFRGEEVSGWVAGAVDHEDLLQSKELPSLSGEFDDIVDSIVQRF